MVTSTNHLGKNCFFPQHSDTKTQPLNHSDLPPCFHDNKILLCEFGGGFLSPLLCRKKWREVHLHWFLKLLCPLLCTLFLFFFMKETLFSTCHTKGASFSNSQTNLLMSKETNSAGLVWRRMLLVCFLHKCSKSSSICFTTSSLTVLCNTDAFMMALQEVLNKPRAKYFTTFAISPWTVFFRSPEG